jgi:hypothetical protein
VSRSGDDMVFARDSKYFLRLRYLRQHLLGDDMIFWGDPDWGKSEATGPVLHRAI